MKAIVCVQNQDGKWAIGNKNSILFHFKDDMKMFRQQTEYQIVLCGRKTFESLPNGPLKNRIHIVLTRDKQYDVEKNYDSPVIICHNKTEVFQAIKNFTDDDVCTLNSDNVWVIGGEEIYRMFLPYCTSCVVTMVRDQEKKQADTFFPNLDEQKNWKCSVIQVSENDPITFYQYCNTEVKEI